MRWAILALLLCGGGAFSAETGSPTEAKPQDIALIAGDVLHANALEFLGLTFRDVVAKPGYSGGELRFDDCHARAYGGNVTGALAVTLQDGVYTARFEVTDCDVAAVVRQFGSPPDNFAGRLSGWIELHMPAGRVDLLIGRGEITVSNGTLVQLPLLANLLIGDPQSTRGKDRFEARFELRDNRIQVLNAKLISPAAKIAMKGTIGFDGDLRLLLAPKFSFDLVDQVPGLGGVVAPFLGSLTARVARAVVRGQITRPVIVLNPFKGAE